MRRFRDAPKRPINLSMNSEVLDAARAMGMNISHTVDELLTQEVLRRERERWAEDNKAAIAAYNARIEREGSFAERIRRHLATEAEAPDTDTTAS